MSRRTVVESRFLAARRSGRTSRMLDAVIAKAQTVPANFVLYVLVHDEGYARSLRLQILARLDELRPSVRREAVKVRVVVAGMGDTSVPFDWVRQRFLGANDSASFTYVDHFAAELQYQRDKQVIEDAQVRMVSAAGLAAAWDDPHAVPGECRVCRCTDDRACPGGCSWVDKEKTLCSKCAAP